MADATLLELVKEIRWKTLKVLEGVDEAQVRFTPARLNNHILWHACHALVVVEYLSLGGFEGKKPPFAAEWFEKFGPNSKPATISQWPSLSEIVSLLVDQRSRLNALIETLTPEQLDRVVGEAPRCRTLRGMIIHGLHDEADHQGEMVLLKKLWKVRG
jgi:hypothetical protein